MNIIFAVLFYNKPQLTLKCLNHLQAAIGQQPIELMAIDNGSTLENYNLMQSSNFCPIFRIETNVGFGKGMNHALDHSFQVKNADWVFLFSNDVLVDSDFVQNLLALKLDLTKPTIIGPQVYYAIDRTKIAYTHGRVQRQNGELMLEHLVDQSKTEINFPEYYPAAATLWNRKAYDRLKGFNDRFFCYWEDVELAYRCAITDTKSPNHLVPQPVPIQLAPSLKIYHLGRGTTSGKAAYYQHFQNGKILFNNILINDNDAKI